MTNPTLEAARRSITAMRRHLDDLTTALDELGASPPEENWSKDGIVHVEEVAAILEA